MFCSEQPIFLDKFLFEPRSSICICGPTKLGKSTLVHKILKHKQKLFKTEPPKKILFCYSIYQPDYKDLTTHNNLSFHEGLPKENFTTI